MNDPIPSEVITARIADLRTEQVRRLHGLLTEVQGAMRSFYLYGISQERAGQLMRQIDEELKGAQ